MKKPFNDASTFKNWIKFDGRLGDITYVCTMTDDSIEIERDAEAFGLVEQIEESKRLDQGLDDCDADLNETREQLDAVQVKTQVLQDTVGSWLRSTGDKRKRSLTSDDLREKRLRRNPLPSSPGGEGFTTVLDQEPNEDPVETFTSNPENREAEQIATRIEYLEAKREALQRQIDQHNFYLQESCIEARNALTRSAIRQEFVHAAKE